MKFLYSAIMTKNYKALILLLFVCFLWSLFRFILYKRLHHERCWLAFIPIFSYKPMFDLCDIDFLLMGLILIPGIGEYCYNAILAYLFYSVSKRLSKGILFSGISMIFGYFTLSYLALTGNFEVQNDSLIFEEGLDLDENYEKFLGK